MEGANSTPVVMKLTLEVHGPGGARESTSLTSVATIKVCLDVFREASEAGFV